MKNAENRNAQMPDEPVTRAAMLDRDPTFDGMFVYGVLTGETIAYAFRETALGPLLMAATVRGVCFAQFGISEQSLIEQLQGEFSLRCTRQILDR